MFCIIIIKKKTTTTTTATSNNGDWHKNSVWHVLVDFVRCRLLLCTHDDYVNDDGNDYCTINLIASEWIACFVASVDMSPCISSLSNVFQYFFLRIFKLCLNDSELDFCTIWMVFISAKKANWKWGFFFIETNIFSFHSFFVGFLHLSAYSGVKQKSIEIPRLL